MWGGLDAHLPRTARTIFELPGADVVVLREQSEESDAAHFVFVPCLEQIKLNTGAPAVCYTGNRGTAQTPVKNRQLKKLVF